MAKNGVVMPTVYRDLKGCADALGMNYDSVKAKKRINGAREFKNGLVITECNLIGSKRTGNMFKFDPEYKKAKKKLFNTIPATEEEQKMLNWRNDNSMNDDI